MAAVSDVCASSRELLNDRGGDTYTDAYLLPYVQILYRVLQRVYGEAGHPFIKKFSGDIALGVGATEPALPPDLVEPFKMEERSAVAGSVYFPMYRMSFGLPQIISGVDLLMWIWEGGKISTLASTEARQVRIYYERSVAELVDVGSPILIPKADDALAFGTAGLGARSRGQAQLARDWGGMWTSELRKLVNTEALPLWSKLEEIDKGEPI